MASTTNNNKTEKKNSYNNNNNNNNNNGNGEKRTEEELTHAIIIGERLRAAADEAGSFKLDCAAVSKLAEKLVDRLRSLVRFFAASSLPIYDRPVRRILSEAAHNLDRAFSLVRKCRRRRGVLRRVVTIIGAADFRKASNLLEASVGDLAWLQNIVDSSEADGYYNGVVLTLPPIASNDPILAWVWSSIASILMGPLTEKIEAANQLASLAQDNDRNKQIIVDEDGVPPLLRLLKENSSHLAQIAGATGLYYLCNDRDRVSVVVRESGVPVIVKALSDSPMKVQSWLAKLVAQMAGNDPVAQEDFARENVIRPLVTLLSFETFEEENHLVGNGIGSVGSNKHRSLHSIVQINREMERNESSVSSNSVYSYHNLRPFVNSFSSLEGGSSKGWKDRRERESERPEVKLELKLSCAEALWMLAKGSVSNSKRITETKGLLCLAKLVEKEEGDLMFNCLMTLKEIAAAAESNADLRRAAFKTNSAAAKAVVDQLLRVINELDSPALLVPAIKAVGSLARTFPARETRVIGPLVAQLGNQTQEVAIEVAVALGKFVCPENFLCDAHSKTIIEFNGIPPLMKLLRGNERGLLHGLFLLCHLALHAGNHEALEEARVLNALEGVDRTLLVQCLELRELVTRAIYHINLYHTGIHPQRLMFVP